MINDDDNDGDDGDNHGHDGEAGDEVLYAAYGIVCADIEYWLLALQQWYASTEKVHGL